MKYRWQYLLDAAQIQPLPNRIGRSQIIMVATLTLSSKLSPFPFAAIAIATYTQKADLVFDETATAISLDLNGSKITVEDEIVHAFAKVGGLSGDSVKVSKVKSRPPQTALTILLFLLPDTIILLSCENPGFRYRIFGNCSSSRFS